MIHAAIVEDCREDADLLVQYLRRFEQEKDCRFQISQFQDGDEIALNYKGGYDLLLLDIELQFMNGMKAAEEIRKVDPEVIIMFITCSPQYAIRGYAVDAFDYILKPVEYSVFEKRMDRVLQRLEKKKSYCISVPCRGGIRKLDTSDICCVEVQDHNLIFHLKDESFTTTGTLRETEEALEGRYFVRCGKAYLINLEYVDRIDGEDALVHGEKIPISRSRRRAVLDAMNHYLGEVL